MQTDTVLSRVRLIMANAHEFPCEPGYRLHHGERVARIAADICAVENIAADAQELFFGALMHDIGKAGCPKGVSHSVHGADIVGRHFADLLTPDESSRIREIVAQHCCRPKSKWYEGREKPAIKPEILAVQDADILDHFGASGIWLSLHWAAAKNSSPAETAAYWFDSPQSNEWRAESERSLNYGYSRATLEKLVAEMNAFFRNWN